MMPPDRVAIRLQAVLCRYQGFELFVDRLEVGPGEAVALVGPSGSGKSTLLELLALARRPDSLKMIAIEPEDGKRIDIGQLWQKGDGDRLTALRARFFGYVLQQGGLLPFLTAGRNIALSQQILGQSDPDLICYLAERLEIGHLLDRLPATLSVGQRQRVAIARALAHRPCILLADEPTASVHPTLADGILETLLEHSAESSMALVVATHDQERFSRHGFAIAPLQISARDGQSLSYLSRSVDGFGAKPAA
jgi:putative ABC transport system ATP-binding protein